MDDRLAAANAEIRRKVGEARLRRLERERIEHPFRYLDRLITRLEGYHLQGQTRIPETFVPRLREVAKMLPDGVTPPRRWRRRVHDVIEQCFALEEQLLRLRYPGGTGGMAGAES